MIFFYSKVILIGVLSGADAIKGGGVYWGFIDWLYLLICSIDKSSILLDFTNNLSLFLGNELDTIYFINYFDKYSVFLLNNTLNCFTKDVISFKF